MQLTPLIQLPNAWSAVGHRVGIHVFEGRLTVTDMNRMEAVGDKWFGEHSGQVVELVIVYPSGVGMTGEERTKMAQMIKRWELRRAASATVILADGIRGAVQRSVLTALMLMAPAPHPVRVFGNIGDATSFLGPHVEALSGATVRMGLWSAVERLCADFRRARELHHANGATR